MVTKVQSDKLELFRRHPIFEDAVQLMRQAIQVAGLSNETLGVDWGVTVCPDRHTIFRINRGNYALIDLRDEPVDDSNRPEYETVIVLAVIGSELGRITPLSVIHSQPGFVRHVPDSVALFVEYYGKGKKILENKKVARAFAEHAATNSRKLPNPNWHNPAVNVLLA